MIYSIPLNKFPSEQAAKSATLYTDQSGTQWLLSQNEKGLFLKEVVPPGGSIAVDYIVSGTLSNEEIKIVNTNCFFLPCASSAQTLVVQEEVIKLLQHNNLEIWTCIGQMFLSRLEIDNTLTKDEINELEKKADS